MRVGGNSALHLTERRRPFPVRFMKRNGNGWRQPRAAVEGGVLLFALPFEPNKNDYDEFSIA